MNVTKLIQQFGKQKARAYLLKFFEDENNLKYFASLFPDHV